MLTLKQIAEKLGITPARAKLGVKKAGAKPLAYIRKTYFYDEAHLTAINNALYNTPTRKRKKKSAEQTADAPAGLPEEQAAQGSETTVPQVGEMEVDPRLIPDEPSDM